MDNHISTMVWVHKCIESCTNIIQLNNARKLVELYKKNYQHLFFYKFLEGKWYEHKKYLTHEQIN